MQHFPFIPQQKSSSFSVCLSLQFFFLCAATFMAETSKVAVVEFLELFTEIYIIMSSFFPQKKVSLVFPKRKKLCEKGVNIVKCEFSNSR